jgi:hypothetical protein
MTSGDSPFSVNNVSEISNRGSIPNSLKQRSNSNANQNNQGPSALSNDYEE